jgi:peroxiredoxin
LTQNKSGIIINCLTNITTYQGETMALRVGQRAPDFTLKNHLGGETSLSDYRYYKNVALAFFPLAWTPV